MEDIGKCLGVETIIGIGKWINKILTDGLISDTIVYILYNFIKI